MEEEDDSAEEVGKTEKQMISRQERRERWRWRRRRRGTKMDSCVALVLRFVLGL